MNVLRCLRFFRYGFRQINSDILQFIRFNLLVFSIIFFFTYISAIAAIRITYSRDMQEILVLLFPLPVVTYLAAGSMYYYISFSKGITVRLNHLYRAYRWFATYLVYAFFTICMYLFFWKGLPDLFTGPLDITSPVIAGSVLFIYVIFRMFFLPLVLVDTRLPFEEAVIESLRLTRPIQGQIFCFLLISLLLCALGLLIVGAGILYTGGITLLAYIKFYLVVRDEHYQD